MLVDLLRDRISPDKNLGQHFILDEKVIFEAVSMCNDIDRQVTKESHVLEIGPGPGSLTLELLKTGARVTAFEIDQQAVIHLGRYSPDWNKDFRFLMLMHCWPNGQKT